MFAGLTDVIPFIGGYLASAPAVFAVSSKGTPSMLIVAAAMMGYQEFESRILVPRVYGRTLRLSPALVLIALLIGGTLLGMLGALLALPVAAGVQMIVRELRVELPGEGPEVEAMRERDDRVGDIYEHLAEHASSEGSRRHRRPARRHDRRERASRYAGLRRARGDRGARARQEGVGVARISNDRETSGHRAREQRSAHDYSCSAAFRP